MYLISREQQERTLRNGETLNSWIVGKRAGGRSKAYIPTQGREMKGEP